MYVIEAYENAKKQELASLHSHEAPIALLTSLIANTNRDSKKKREPYKINDFFLFEPQDMKNIPMAIYGSAAMEMVSRGLFPSWALFIFKDLKEASAGSPPKLLAFMCDDAILLAPALNSTTVKGMLIAREPASKKRLHMTSPCGEKIYVELPVITSKFLAQEDVELSLIN